MYILGRREKAILRGTDYHIFDSQTGSLAQQKVFVKYGFTKGAANSPERQQQVKKLQATEWSVFRKQWSQVYKNDKAQWRNWLLGMDEGKNIFQAALLTIQLVSQEFPYSTRL